MMAGLFAFRHRCHGGISGARWVDFATMAPISGLGPIPGVVIFPEGH